MPPRKRLRDRAVIVLDRLGEEFPGTSQALCALIHDNAFQLLCATILSAQCTDERVNMVVPNLFAAYPEPADLAGAEPGALEKIIRSTGFFHAKAHNLIGMARDLVENFGGEVPKTMEELTTLPGVGRKTANVVLSVAFGTPGLPVDTHVGRLSRRLGLTTQTDPVKVELELGALVPPEDWGAISLRLILHGRATCFARRPRCEECLLADICPKVGVGNAPIKAKPRPSTTRRVNAAG